jgi:hypothetical protein
VETANLANIEGVGRGIDAREERTFDVGIDEISEFWCMLAGVSSSIRGGFRPS